jgi:hypothetical protein
VEKILFCAGDLESYLRRKRDETISSELAAAKEDPNWSNLDSTARSDAEDNIKADAEGRFRQEASDVLNYLASFYRDVLLLRSTGREDMVMNTDMLPAVRQGSEIRDTDGIMAAMRVIESARESISRNVKISNCLEAMLLRLTAEEITGAHR